MSFSFDLGDDFQIQGSLVLSDKTKTVLSSFENNVKRSTGTATKATQGMSGAMSTAIGTFTGMIAARALPAMMQFVKQGVGMAAQQETLLGGFNALTKGIPATTLSLQTLQKATSGTVSKIGLLRSANNALALGLPTEQLNDLFHAAQVVGNAMGRTTLEAVTDLTTGIGRQSKLILDNLGILVNTDQAYQDFAATLGKTSGQLTTAERKTAFMTAAIAELNEKAAMLEGTTSKTQIYLERWDAGVSDLKTSLGALGGASIAAWGSVYDAVAGALEPAGDAMNTAEHDAWSLAFNYGVASDNMIDDSVEMEREVNASNYAVGRGFRTLESTVEDTLDSIVTMGEKEWKRFGSHAYVALSAWDLYMKGVSSKLDDMWEGSIEAYRNALGIFEEEVVDPNAGSNSDRVQQMLDFYAKGNPSGSFNTYEGYLAAGGSMATWDALSVSQRNAMLTAVYAGTITAKEWIARNYTPPAGDPTPTPTAPIVKYDYKRTGYFQMSDGSSKGYTTGWQDTKAIMGDVWTDKKVSLREAGYNIISQSYSTSRQEEAASGYIGLVDRPTLMLVGERGSEYVDVQPMNQTGSGRRGGMGAGGEGQIAPIHIALHLDGRVIAEHVQNVQLNEVRSFGRGR